MKHFIRLCNSLCILFITVLLFCQPVVAQNDTITFFDPSPAFNKSRFYTLTVSGALAYTGVILGLNEYWYKNYPRTSFHFFNDNAEWNQIDKAGHVFTSYFESLWCMKLLQWSGVEHKKALWYGGAAGTLFQTTIEVLDGFSEKWGASWGDFTANVLGSALFISQEKIWKEQRILIKYSFHPVSYSSDLQERVQTLYGDSYTEQLLKDYNGHTYWLSGNIGSFLNNESKFPKWLNIAFGYGAEGMLGGFDNIVREDNIIIEDYSYIPRYRQYYLSLDIDLTKIKTNSGLLKTILYIFNTIKIPAPALEYNSKNKLKLHAIYF